MNFVSVELTNSYRMAVKTQIYLRDIQGVSAAVEQVEGCLFCTVREREGGLEL